MHVSVDLGRLPMSGALHFIALSTAGLDRPNVCSVCTCSSSVHAGKYIEYGFYETAETQLVLHEINELSFTALSALGYSCQSASLLKSRS